MKQTILVFFLALAGAVHAQNYYKISNEKITLDNGVISRELNIHLDSLFSVSFEINRDGNNYINKSRDFSFLVNDVYYSGFSRWEILKTRPYEDGAGGKGMAIFLKGRDNDCPVIVEVDYALYPDLPLIRKQILITNNSDGDIKLESVNVEDPNTKLSYINSVVYHNFGRMKQIGTFVGDWDDPVAVVHDITGRRGMALGNEAMAVLKRTAYHTKDMNNVEIGLTHTDQNFPFRKWLKPGETWSSPKVFICLYSHTDDGFSVINNQVNLFMVRYMRPQVIKLKEKPVFVYNTWYPFRTFISDSLIRRVAKSAAACGIQEFIIDDGWQINYNGHTSTKGWGNNYGDWLVDTLKFPGGLKPTFDYIKSLGMKPGLWISIGSATKDSKVFKEHPEWFIKNKDGELSNLHLPDGETDFYTSCFGTDWYTYIKNVIVGLSKNYGLAYAKLDFAAVTSPYVTDVSRSGCYATDHPYHRDHNESFGVIYNRVLQLFDDLHREAPGLFIDCTFETAGKLQLMDYAIAQHADGNWLSNFEEPSPVGPLRVRQMAWWRTPELPASSLVIGNLPTDDPDFEFGLKSLIGTLPIVLGDPTKMPAEKTKRINDWSQWMRRMEDKYDYMSYRKDLPGFGQPQEGSWDGWQRINFIDKNGGIFGVFRQGALENSRRVFLTDLQPGAEYEIRTAPDGNTIYTGSGEDLMEKGINVPIEEKYGGRIFEVAMK